MHEQLSLHNHQENPLSESRRILEELEKTGEYVFHGSPTAGIEVLEARQPHTIKEGVSVSDGDPSVACTQFADIAIFRAITNQRPKNQSVRSSFGTSNGELRFQINKSFLKWIHEQKLPGYVYVLPADIFNDYNAYEVRSNEPVTVQKIFEVSVDDLPENIQVMPDEWANLSRKSS